MTGSSDNAPMRPLIFDLLFHDDRMFVLEVCPVESREPGMSVLDLSAKHSRRQPQQWALVTRRNIPGYPPHRIDHFPTEGEALAYYKRVVVETPRKSLGEKAPNPLPTLEQYTAWLVEQQLFDTSLPRKRAATRSPNPDR